VKLHFAYPSGAYSEWRRRSAAAGELQVRPTLEAPTPSLTVFAAHDAEI